MPTQLEHPYSTRSSPFPYYSLAILKILFVWLKWLKLLKDPLEEDSPIVAIQISDTLFIYSDFIFFFFYLPILKVSYV